MPSATTQTPQNAATDTGRTRVVLLFGGRSSEHPVSCSTAKGVLNAIDTEKYDVIPLGISASGKIVLMDEDSASWPVAPDGRSVFVPDTGKEVIFPTNTEQHELFYFDGSGKVESLGHIDVVFPLLHGPFGEDGTVQGLFELGDVRYVGSGVATSAISIDKHLMKVLFNSAGIPQADYLLVKQSEWERSAADLSERVESFGWPVFVKPARAGSSMGISKVRSKEELETALEQAFKHDPKVIVEPELVGREIEVAVLQELDGTSRASVPGEIVVGEAHDFYDYEAKYFDSDNVELTIDPVLPEKVKKEIQNAALDAFEALDAEGLGRVDFFVTDSGEYYINEINTLPGFTPTSMYPMLWKASGVDYPELIDRLIQLALHRPVGLR